MYLGKQIRLERIFNQENGRTIIVPMDHGVSLGAVPGLLDMKQAVKDLSAGGADAVLMHKGLIRCGYSHQARKLGLIMHLSASTELSPFKNSKTLVGTVEEAIKHGADCVSIHVNLGDPNDAKMLSDFGRVAEACDNWGIPLLAMIYGRGPSIPNSFAPEVIAHCARVGVELGADIVKVSYTGDPESFADVIATCCVPVVIAGGPRMDSTRELLTMVADSLKAGGAGISIGRNAFGHPHRLELMQALRAIVHGNADVETALKLISEEE